MYCPNVLEYWKQIWLIKVANRKKTTNETEKLKMHWQSPTFNVQFSRTIAFACMFNKTTKIEKKHQHLMPKKTKQTRALQACFSKSELEKELATFIMVCFKILCFSCALMPGTKHTSTWSVYEIFWMQSK